MTFPAVAGKTYRIALPAATEQQGFTLLRLSQLAPTSSIGDCDGCRRRQRHPATEVPGHDVRAAQERGVVSWQSTDGTASSASGDIAASKALVLETDVTSRTVSVTVKGDTTAQPAETVFVRLVRRRPAAPPPSPTESASAPCLTDD